MTKDAVIAILKKETGYISGEKIGQTLGISRAAVNTAVRTLRREGYEIQSSTNKGYRLTTALDTLHTGDLMALLSPERMASIECLDCVESTNRSLQLRALEGAPEGQIVLAGEQIDGRGRRGRRFYSPPKKGIYLSYLLRPQELPSDVTTITAWTAVAISRAIGQVCGITPQIKWVNDLYLHNKKIAGILTEMSIESESGHIQYVIIGIGLNVSQKADDFPEELLSSAGSLFSETGTRYPRAALAAAIIGELDQLRADWPQKKAAYLDAYRSSSIMMQKKIVILNQKDSKSAVVTGISDDFGLCVTYPDGSSEVLQGGEVSIRF